MLENRGLMLDISRGKVYTLEYLLQLVDILAKFRYNVLQLYVEHTFDFKKHPEICRGSDPISAEDIRKIQDRCKQKGIELQANLQCLGHCNRILTRPEHMQLAESDMFWSLCPASDDSLLLLEDLFSEYLPLFESDKLNICFDEPYDIGKGKSAVSGKTGDELYVAFFKKVHALAAQYGKKVMAFGDVFCHNPQYLHDMPKDIIYLDWCYDPKPIYGTPEMFHKNDMPFWVCPGSGNWNTLFPRLDGGITNIVNLVTEGISQKAEGMLFTDWNDHGGYTQPSPGFYLYGYAGAASWMGEDPGKEEIDQNVESVLGQPGYAAVVHSFAEIYYLPPIWSKNRSECVMALFDEPIFGKSVRGMIPPDTLEAYNLTLPDGIAPVFERHSQHPLRPFFSIPVATCEEIRRICTSVQQQILNWQEGTTKAQFLYISQAFLLMVDKLALSRKIIQKVESGNLEQEHLLMLEDELRCLIGRFVRLQMCFTDCWMHIAKLSEIETTLVYFANIISRLDYLRDWLSHQRENLATGSAIDTAFATYCTADYETLPTY